MVLLPVSCQECAEKNRSDKTARYQLITICIDLKRLVFGVKLSERHSAMYISTTAEKTDLFNHYKNDL